MIKEGTKLSKFLSYMNEIDAAIKNGDKELEDQRNDLLITNVMFQALPNEKDRLEKEGNWEAVKASRGKSLLNSFFRLDAIWRKKTGTDIFMIDGGDPNALSKMIGAYVVLKK